MNYESTVDSPRQHSLLTTWSGLRESSYTLYRVYNTPDSLEQPLLDPGDQIVVAFDRNKGLVVFGFHDQQPLSESWEMTLLICGELREWSPTLGFPIRPLLVSSTLPGHSRHACFVPATNFVGCDERVSGTGLDALLRQVNVTPQPHLMEYLQKIFVLVEPYAPLETPVRNDDQTTRWSLVEVG